MSSARRLRHRRRRIGPLLIDRYEDRRYGCSTVVSIAALKLRLGRRESPFCHASERRNEWLLSWSWRGDRRTSRLRPLVLIKPGTLTIDFVYENLSAAARRRELEARLEAEYEAELADEHEAELGG